MDELTLDPTQAVVDADADAAMPAPAPSLMDQLKALPPKIMASPRGRAAAIFGVGLLVGWIILGWILFPIQWSNTDPWDMRGAHQERYVVMLAEYYWETQDLGFVLDSINGWDRDDLDRVVSQLMNAKDGTPAQRAQLTALGEALSLPMYDRGLLATLLGNSKGLLIAIALALVPVLGGIVLVLVLAVRQVAVPTIEQELADLEEELAQEANALKEDEIWAEDGEDEEDDEEDEDDEPEREGSSLASMAAETDGVDDEISDMLATFFDDDDTSLEALQALSKGLKDVNVDYMLRTMQGMVALMDGMPSQRG